MSASPRDYTQYTFDGKTTGKGRTVLALVQRFARDHPGATFEQLRAAFPDHLQADSPTQFSRERRVVARMDDVLEQGQKRYFWDEADWVALDEESIVVSREWNGSNFRNVLAQATELGYEVTVAPNA